MRGWKYTLAACLLCLAPLASAAEKTSFPADPLTHDGKKWRIGYIQGGPYADYHSSLKALLQGLIELGWIEKTQIPDEFDPTDTDKLWAWMGTHLHSDYLEFPPDAFWDGKRDETLYPQLRRELLERLGGRQDIDLMLALGTWSGQTLAGDAFSTPTMVMSTTDPIASKIIESVEDSGHDHIHARVDPHRHEQQVRLFHDIIGFRNLGVVYEDSEEGRGFGSLESIERVAEERGFELIRCFAPYNGVTPEQSERAVAACHEELAAKTEAMFITRHPGVTIKNMPALLQPLFAHKIPSFSQSGSTGVEQGVLFSISISKFKYVGQFYAQTLAKILNGARPRDLPQLFQSPPKIAINLATAKRIGYDPPLDILGAADEIYQDIPWLKEAP
jgi:ABC-type uncharacterized transport system substrate-binding protein